MSITPAECKAAHKLLGWSNVMLAVEAGVDQSTILNFEIGKSR